MKIDRLSSLRFKGQVQHVIRRRRANRGATSARTSEGLSGNGGLAGVDGRVLGRIDKIGVLSVCWPMCIVSIQSMFPQILQQGVGYFVIK